jgi:hypothetical protein
MRVVVLLSVAFVCFRSFFSSVFSTHSKFRGSFWIVHVSQAGQRIVIRISTTTCLHANFVKPHGLIANKFVAQLLLFPDHHSGNKKKMSESFDFFFLFLLTVVRSLILYHAKLA